MHQPTALLGGLLAAAGSVVGYVLPALPRPETEFRQHLPAALPIHVSAKSQEGCASGEQRRGAAEILSQIGVEQGRTYPTTHPAAVPINAVRVTVHNMRDH